MSKLMSKLKNNGISGVSQSWFTSYLSTIARKQYVSVKKLSYGDHAVLLEENRYCLDISIAIDSDI